MARPDDLQVVPPGLPVPVDDGAADHLPGSRIPPLGLASTAGEMVRLGRRPAKWTVVYCYPRTGRPDEEAIGGTAAWNAIPGARGCTPQSCSYRDHYRELQAVGAEVFGLSTQTTEYQREMVERLQLPFAVLSDAELAFARALRLPTFEVAWTGLLRRLTFVVSAGTIVRSVYPVLPPDSDAQQIVAWLGAQ